MSVRADLAAARREYEEHNICCGTLLMALEREIDREREGERQTALRKCCELLTEPQNEGSRLQARSHIRMLPSVSFSQLAASPESQTHAVE